MTQNEIIYSSVALFAIMFIVIMLGSYIGYKLRCRRLEREQNRKNMENLSPTVAYERGNYLKQV